MLSLLKKILPSILILLFIFVVGLIVRVANITTNDLWYDEVYGIFEASHPPSQIIQLVSAQVSPPLFQLLLRYWMAWFGTSDLQLKIFPIIFGILSILMAYFVGKEIFGKRVGLLTSLFVALSPLHIYYSLEVRMYSMVVFFSLCSVFFFWKAYKENKLWDKIFYIIFSLLGLYTHLTFSFLIIAQVFFIFIVQRKNIKGIKNWLFIFLFIFLGFLPWFPTAIQQCLQAGQYSLQYLDLSLRPFNVPEYTILSFLWFLIPSVFLPLLFVCLLILVTFAFFQFKFTKSCFCFQFRENKKRLLFVFLYLFIPLVLFTWFMRGGINTHHVISPSIALYLILASGLMEIKSKSLKYLFLLLILIPMVMTDIDLSKIRKNSFFRQNEKIAEYIQENEKPGDVIIISSSWFRFPFLRYYQGKLPVYGFFPEVLQTESGFGDLEFIKKENQKTGSVIVNKDNIEQIQNYISKYDRVWYLILDIASDPKKLTLEWLINHWQLKEAKNHIIYLFERR